MKYDTNSKELLDSVVCFIDILGFSSMIKDYFSKNSGQELLNRMHNSLTEAYKFMKEINENSGAVKIFTDNIVIGKAIRDDGESELGHLLDHIASYQFQLALEGLFVRGGVAVGLHYMDNDIVFGPALIDAYKLESERANAPRVILSKEVKELVKEHIQYYSTNYPAPQLNLICIDADGEWFINYLQAAIIDEDALDMSTVWLQQHKTIVEEKLKEYKSNSKVFNKYRWVAQYHNYFCKLNVEGENDLIIDDIYIIDEPRTINRDTDINS